MDTMAQRGSRSEHLLRERIIAAIAPWRKSDAKPPFSTEQLVVMALLFHGQLLLKKSIFHWINKTFPWYARKVSEAFWEQNWERHSFQSKQEKAALSVTDFYSELQLVLSSIEFPSYDGVADGTPSQWSIKTTEGLELLRPILGVKEAEKPKNLGFCSLPAELRNVIYDTVFQYPIKPGLTFPRCTRGAPIRFIISLQQVERKEDKVIRKKSVENTRLIEKILGPLLTCRQFHNEAMPSFYRINNFCFEDLESFSTWLQRLTPKRRQHLSHISLAYPRRDRVNAELAFGYLAKFDCLRIINLRVEETSWLKYARTRTEVEAARAGRDPQQAKERIQSALDMPGMNILRSIRGLEEVNITGIRKDTVQKITIDTLRADMTKPKKLQPAAVKKKRKSTSDPIIEITSTDVEGASQSRKRIKAA